jgi:VCBS repeat-containing protein
VVVHSDGSFTYTPTVAAREGAAAPTATASEKADHFTVTASDAYGGSVAIPVTVTVDPNHAPTAAATVATPLSGLVSGNLHAVDADGDPLTYTVVAPPSRGTVSVTGAGTFTHTPRPRPRAPRSHGGARHRHL